MKKIPFNVNAYAARLIGRENVSKLEGAILELVKNTYDADATICLLYYNNKDKYLLIADNGCGMNEDTEKLMQQILMEKHTLDLAGTGIGIQNVVTRLRMYYGEELSVVLESEPEKGTKFTFWLPIPENPEKDIE